MRDLQICRFNAMVQSFESDFKEQAGASFCHELHPINASELTINSFPNWRIAEFQLVEQKTTNGPKVIIANLPMQGVYGTRQCVPKKVSLIVNKYSIMHSCSYDSKHCADDSWCSPDWEKLVAHWRLPLWQTFALRSAPQLREQMAWHSC